MVIIWKKLDDDRVFAEHPSGFTIVKPVLGDDPAPLFCDVCGMVNGSIDDVVTYHTDGCCSTCSLRWVDVNRDRWASGWRD